MTNTLFVFLTFGDFAQHQALAAVLGFRHETIRVFMKRTRQNFSAFNVVLAAASTNWENQVAEALTNEKHSEASVGFETE